MLITKHMYHMRSLHWAALILAFACALLITGPAALAESSVMVFNGTTPQDIFVNLQAGQRVTATLVCSDGTVDPILFVYGPSGSLVASDDDGHTPCDNFYSSIVRFTVQETGSHRFAARSYDDASDGPYRLTITILSVEEQEVPFNPGDARLNQRTKDRGASVAVYCKSGLSLWRIDDQGEGTETITVTQEEIDQIGIPTEEEHHYIIASANVPLGQIVLYRLWTGEFQVNAAPVRPDADPYIFIWRNCERQK